MSNADIASAIASAKGQVEAAVMEGQIEDSPDARTDLFARLIVRRCASTVADAHTRVRAMLGDAYGSRAYAEELAGELLAQFDSVPGFDDLPHHDWFSRQVDLILCRDAGNAIDDAWESAQQLWLERFAERLVVLDPGRTADEAETIANTMVQSASATNEEPGTAAMRWLHAQRPTRS